MWRNYKRAHNHRRLVTLIHGDTWGTLYGLNEDMLSHWGEPYEASLDFLGMPWATTVFGLESTDPMLVAGTVVSTRRLELGWLWQLLLPLGLAFLLGKVFCSHLCPMRLLFEIAQLVRRGLEKLGVPMPDVRHDARFGGWVMLGGLLATLSLGTVIWLYLLPYVSLSTSIFLYVSAGMTTGLVAVVFVWVLIDLFVAPGYFCHNLCPTGFLLENVGRASVLKLHKLGDDPCPKGCEVCVTTCPYHLSPKAQTHTPACDNCGKCVVTCPKERLARKFRLPVVLLVLLAALAVPNVAAAHHNKGLPHYGYFENYPQVPTDEYIVIKGKWELGCTFFNFQGLQRRNADTPNDVKIYCYLYDMKADKAYLGAADFKITKGKTVVSEWRRKAVDEEAVYSSRETMPSSGNFRLTATIDGRPVATLKFYISLGQDGPNWMLIAGGAIPVLIVFGLALYGRQRKKKRKKKKRPPPEPETA